jgi:hypothetical protein
MPRLQVQPRGHFPDISFGREPSNSTGGTFTHVAAGFPGAHPNTAELTTERTENTEDDLFMMRCVWNDLCDIKQKPKPFL